MNWKQEYEKWISYELLDSEMRELLESAKENERLLEDCFYKNLAFGTAGMRGELGAGTNRLNVYTIRKAAEGLARYMEAQGEEAKRRGVVIAYDSRHKSPEFAMEAALTLGAHNIKTYVFDSLRPTPELSFAVRHLQTYSGIVITASHNPPEYNGFKVYGEDGGQLPPNKADQLTEYVNQIENELTIKSANQQNLLDSGMLHFIGREVDDEYIKHLKEVILDPILVKNIGSDLSIVYSPLHGAANISVQRSLKEAGFGQVMVVREQEHPDPDFSTVTSPNPEDESVFELAIEHGTEVNADLLIATDPDGDRIGVSVRNNDGQFIILTGNQIGALMMDYLLSHKKKKGILPENAIVLKSIVTSELGRAITQAYGVEMFDVLTGFKFIAEKIREYEETGEFVFQMGYEESYGYLIRDFARDKDAVQAALFICEVAAYHKNQGKTLHNALIDIYKKYGFYREGQVSLSLQGQEGLKRIQSILTSFRKDIPSSISGLNVISMADYYHGFQLNIKSGEKEEILLPKSDVLKFHLEDGSWFCVRPSGTEPKIKFYFDIKGESMEDSERKFNDLKSYVLERTN